MQIVREFLFEEESCAICGIGAHNAHEILRLMMAKGKLVLYFSFLLVGWGYLVHNVTKHP